MNPSVKDVGPVQDESIICLICRFLPGSDPLNMTGIDIAAALLGNSAYKDMGELGILRFPEHENLVEESLKKSLAPA